MNLYSYHKIIGRGRFDPVNSCAKRMGIMGIMGIIIRGRLDPVNDGA